MGLDLSTALAIVVFVLLVGGLEIVVAVRYKRKTGNDHRGALFWKRVFRRFGSR